MAEKCPVCGELHTGVSSLRAPVQYGNGVKTLASSDFLTSKCILLKANKLLILSMK
jgi:hypothetical protein